MTITEFLLARIAEDEARARAAIADDSGSDEGFAGQYAELIKPPSGVGLAQGGFGEAAARIIATYAVPRRVLAECEAKRRIIDRHTHCDDTTFGYPCDDLLALASVYADHPDFDPTWEIDRPA